MLTVMFENEAQGSIKPAHKENAPIANIKGRGAKPVGRGNGGKGLGALWKFWLPARREHVSDLVVSKNEDPASRKEAGARWLDGIAFNDHYRILQQLGAGAFGTVSKVGTSRRRQGVCGKRSALFAVQAQGAGERSS